MMIKFGYAFMNKYMNNMPNCFLVLYLKTIFNKFCQVIKPFMTKFVDIIHKTESIYKITK